MKRNCVAMLLICCFIHFAIKNSSARKPPQQLVSVAFYNFENLFDTIDDPKKFDEDFTPGGAYHYDSKVYRQKLHNLATVLGRLGLPLCAEGPALIGTAEIENDRVLTDLAAQPEIKDRHYRFVHFESPDSRGIDVALLYHPKLFQVLQARALPTDISVYSEKGGRTRDVLYVVGILAGDTVHVFVNHWPSRRGGEEASTPLRMLAAGVSRRVIDSLMRQNPLTRVLLMGDLNDDPVNMSITKGLGASGNIRALEAGGLYNPFFSYYRKGIGTLGYNDSWNLFDQIILSSSFFDSGAGIWHYDHAEIFNREFLKETFGPFKGYPHRSFEGSLWINGYSDHFPVLLYFTRGSAP